VSGEEGPAGRPAGRRLRLLPARRLPDSGRALRELDAALQRLAQHSRRRVRSVLRPLAPPNRAPPDRARLPRADRERRVFADRAGHADRAGGEKRHPDRRVREGRLRQRAGADGGGARRGAPAPEADPDDLLRLRAGLRAALDRERGGLPRAPAPAYDRPPPGARVSVRGLEALTMPVFCAAMEGMPRPRPGAAAAPAASLSPAADEDR